MTYPPNSGWTTPQPPQPDRPIHGRKVAAGIGWAVLGQVLAIGIGVLVTILLAQGDSGQDALYGIYLVVLLQIILFIVCMVVGIIWIVRRDRGIGLGLLIGWAVTVIVFPVVGVGVCLAILSGYSQT